MASPPFNINEALPGDTDIVSQHPSNARTFRDVVESWLLVNHNVQGRHDEAALDFKADPGAGVASVTEVWASSTGNAAGKLKQRRGTGAVEYVGVPPGMIMASGRASEFEGWLFCNGQAVSRSTYADLFDAIGTTFGVGDGSTTFNVPDLCGRVPAGQDDAGVASKNRLTGLSGGVDGDVLGAAGGAESHVLTVAQLAAHNHGITDPGHVHGVNNGTNVQRFPGGALNFDTTLASTRLSSEITIASATTGITVNNTGSDAAHNNVQPTLIVNYFIKT